MDTPGFDPAHGEAIFREIVRGIQTILSISRIAGFLYFTCINQPRLDSFDHQVFRLSRALAGDDYLPCMTFITTFWTTDQPSQQANFNSQLERLKHTWRQAFGVQELHCYQHGRGYNAAWEPTDAFINWFDVPGRNQIAQHAKEMIARRYCGPGASAAEARTPKIVQELTRGIPIHETDAGRSLELRLAPSDTRPMPASIEQHREGPHQQSSSATSDANAGPSREEGHHTGSQDIPRTRQDAPGIPQAPENPWYSKALEFLSPLVPNNVNFSFNVSGPVGGMGGPRGVMTSPMGPRSQEMSFDRLSSVDMLKANGFDSSREGRLRYAAERGIGGQPFSAEWGEAIRQDVLRRNR
ncbi:predicted protein [Aspergillus terreus NIH2624]|uniref:Uncharacterized protein n=1 Tax=Aspergillus terreus (strain NIH 2624 / FGSC A1156) TaxID=341663 RepID=Q0CNE6_ASPTN|nr:uncharacterized protein ATEG_04788 [Aspergillus terreus NIH2624]EAU35235.1 predicted protein [Aspergillus terreus NIH2624]